MKVPPAGDCKGDGGFLDVERFGAALTDEPPRGGIFVADDPGITSNGERPARRDCPSRRLTADLVAIRSRHRTCWDICGARPSGPHLDGFAAALERQSYSAGTPVRYLRAVAHLGHVCARRGTMSSDIDLVFREHVRTCRCPRHRDENPCTTVRHIERGILAQALGRGSHLIPTAIHRNRGTNALGRFLPRL
jgi:hypothetical protein